MRIVDRLSKYLKYKDLSLSGFEKKIGVSHTSLAKTSKSKYGMTEVIADKILSACPDLNPVWLLLGEGEMLKGGEGSVPVSELVSVRFYAVRDTLKAMGKDIDSEFEDLEKVDIDTVSTFCDTYKINADYIMSGIGSVFRE